MKAEKEPHIVRHFASVQANGRRVFSTTPARTPSASTQIIYDMSHQKNMRSYTSAVKLTAQKGTRTAEIISVFTKEKGSAESACASVSVSINEGFMFRIHDLN